MNYLQASAKLHTSIKIKRKDCQTHHTRWASQVTACFLPLMMEIAWSLTPQLLSFKGIHAFPCSPNFSLASQPPILYAASIDSNLRVMIRRLKMFLKKNSGHSYLVSMALAKQLSSICSSSERSSPLSRLLVSTLRLFSTRTLALQFGTSAVWTRLDFSGNTITRTLRPSSSSLTPKIGSESMKSAKCYTRCSRRRNSARLSSWY